MMRIKLVQNDRKPSLYAVFGGESPMDISAATSVRLHFKPMAGGETIVIPGLMLTGIVDELGDVSTAAPYNVAGAGGRMRFDWPSGALANAGYYECEVQVLFPGDLPMTSPETFFIYVRPEIA